MRDEHKVKKAKKDTKSTFMQRNEIEAGFNVMLNQLRDNSIACRQAANAQAALANELRISIADVKKQLRELEGKHAYAVASQQAMLKEVAMYERKVAAVQGAMDA